MGGLLPKRHPSGLVWHSTRGRFFYKPKQLMMTTYYERTTQYGFVYDIDKDFDTISIEGRGVDLKNVSAWKIDLPELEKHQGEKLNFELRIKRNGEDNSILNVELLGFRTISKHSISETIGNWVKTLKDNPF